MSYRVGIGTDIHRLQSGRKLLLGGVEIPFEKGLLGHSDADALLHALIDALFAGIGSKDIGTHFPDTDPAFKDADSSSLLLKCYEEVKGAGYRLSNASIIIIAEKPKMGPYIDQMKAHISELLHVEPSQIAIHAKTNESLGEIGKGEAIAVKAAVMLEKEEL